jgi:hypothetical protein
MELANKDELPQTATCLICLGATLNMTFQTSIDKKLSGVFDYIRCPTFGMRWRSSACRWIPDGVLIMATDIGVKSLALTCLDAMTDELRMR